MSETERESTPTSNSKDDIPQQKIREDLVTTAIKFLQNPRVATRPDSEKELFLQRKGLTRDEIAAAFKASGTSNISENTVAGQYSSLKVAQVREYSNLPAPVPRSKWAIIRDVLNAAALFAGAVYTLRYLYRRFIAPYLFGRKEKTLKDAVEEMNKNVTRLIGDVTAAVQNLSSTVATLQSNQNEKSDIKELKAELASMKALLLSRRQFPPTPSIGPPSIPSWQMGTSESEKLRPGHTGQLSNHGEGISPSSSPEIISVDEMPSNPLPHATDSQCGSSGRDPSESSESNSAELVEMGASGSGGSGEEDTD